MLGDKVDVLPKLKPQRYLAGDKVLSPSGDVVSANANFTSGASCSAATGTFGYLRKKALGALAAEIVAATSLAIVAISAAFEEELP